jgi:hypothetical protein
LKIIHFHESPRLCVSPASSSRSYGGPDSVYEGVGCTRSSRWKNLTVPPEYRGFAEAFEGAPKHKWNDSWANAMREAIASMLAE